MQLSDIWLSAVDEERFGVKTARASNVTASNFKSVEQYCLDNEAEFLIARCSAADIKTAQAMESAGCSLMDTLVYYSFQLDRVAIPSDTGAVIVRAMDVSEIACVESMAKDAFKGYFGHYHADDRLDPRKCDEGYESWASNACRNRDDSHEVLVASSEEAGLFGFATVQRNSDVEGEGVLFGVSPAAQGKGVYRSLMVNAMSWCKDIGCSRMVVSTQINNLAVQKVWVRLGFEPSHSYYTFHKWFDKGL